MRPRDTSREMDELQHKLWMERTAQARAKFVASMFRNAMSIILASLPEGLSEEEIKRQLFFRTYGEHLPADFFDR